MLRRTWWPRMSAPVAAYAPVSREAALASIQRTLITVYYDGGCPLCTKEITHYKQNPKAEQIRWIDITKRAVRSDETVGIKNADHSAQLKRGEEVFDEQLEGLNYETAVESMHVRIHRDRSGRSVPQSNAVLPGTLVSGVDGFVQMWQVLGCFWILALLGKLPITRQAAQLLYFTWRKARPFLPRTASPQDACSTGTCYRK
jgi:hypothetical protein